MLFIPSSFVLGILAALLAPFLMVVGFMVWDNHWHGSAFALNMFKCTLASLWFVCYIIITSFVTTMSQQETITNHNNDNNNSIIVGAVGEEEETSSKLILFPSLIYTTHTIGWLMISSTLGILLGDWTWLEGMRILGARKVIVMDSLKPFFAALVGRLVLGEQLHFGAFVGLIFTVVGVALVGLEKEVGGTTNYSDDDDDKKRQGSRETDSLLVREAPSTTTTATTSIRTGTETFQQQQASQPVMKHSTSSCSYSEQRRERNQSTKEIHYGLFMAVSNIVLHTFGVLITKKYASAMTTWDICFIRFGFAAICMIFVSIGLQLRDSIFFLLLRRRRGIPPPLHVKDERTSHQHDDTHTQHTPTMPHMIPAAMTDNNDNDDNNDDGDGSKESSITLPVPWYKLPPIVVPMTTTMRRIGQQAQQQQHHQQQQQDSSSSNRNRWIHVTVGVFFVSFLHPALTNYAVFQIAFALLLTLESIGPIYSLPLTFWLQKERPTIRACLGAVLAVMGIAILSIWGDHNDDFDKD